MRHRCRRTLSIPCFKVGHLSAPIGLHEAVASRFWFRFINGPNAAVNQSRPRFRASRVRPAERLDEISEFRRARGAEIPSLFTISNLETLHVTRPTHVSNSGSIAVINAGTLQITN